MKKIAITGSSGFIGSFFIKNSSEYSIQEVDLLTQKIEDVDFSGVESVIHLAGIAHQKSLKDEDLYYMINRDLAFETAKHAKLQSVQHFVFMSTVKVYGESTSEGEFWDENSNCNPKDVYGKSKYEAEQLIKGLEDEDFKVAIIRSPLVYGVGVKANMFNLIKLIDRSLVIPFKGINNKRSMVFVGNLTALIKRVVDQQVSGIFLPSDGEPLSTYQLSVFIASSLRKEVWFFKIPAFFSKLLKLVTPSIHNRLFGSLMIDYHRSNDSLGFTPPFTSEEGIRIMVEWYLESGK